MSQHFRNSGCTKSLNYDKQLWDNYDKLNQDNQDKFEIEIKINDDEVKIMTNNYEIVIIMSSHNYEIK